MGSFHVAPIPHYPEHAAFVKVYAWRKTCRLSKLHWNRLPIQSLRPYASHGTPLANHVPFAFLTLESMRLRHPGHEHTQDLGRRRPRRERIPWYSKLVYFRGRI